MALKVPGCRERILALWRALEESLKRSNPKISQRKWVRSVGMDPTRFNAWIHGGQPDLDGLKDLQRVFGVPWQWILVGDEGEEALKKWREAKGAASREQSKRLDPSSVPKMERAESSEASASGPGRPRTPRRRQGGHVS